MRLFCFLHNRIFINIYKVLLQISICKMNIKKILHYTALFTSIALIASCFIPWVHYNSIDTTFTGYNVKPFVTGTNLGRGGIPITIFAVLSFVLTALPTVAAKRTNMFVCALLMAYAMSRHMVFTASLFEGEVVKLAGIYLIVILPIIMLVCSVFPYLKKEQEL